MIGGGILFESSPEISSTFPCVSSSAHKKTRKTQLFSEEVQIGTIRAYSMHTQASTKHKLCPLSLFARFKIGHTPRKFPDIPPATFRFLAYLSQSPVHYTMPYTKLQAIAHTGLVKFLWTKVYHIPILLFEKYSIPKGMHALRSAAYTI